MEQTFTTEDITVTTFRGGKGLELLRNTWDELLANIRPRHFFHLREWHQSYLTCLEQKPDDFLFFLFTKGQTPLAIFPLGFTKFAVGGIQLQALSLPCHDHVLLGDLLWDNESFHLPLFQRLGQHLKSERLSWDIILLPHLLEDSCVIRAVEKNPPARFLVRQEGGCDYTITKGTPYETYLSGLSKNFRRSLKRAAQHLEQLPDGDWRFAFTKGGLDMENRLDDFLDVEASGWKGAAGAGTAIKLNPQLVSFYRDLAITLSTSGRVLINTLDVGDKCIAAQFCLLFEDTAYMLKIGYDENYSRYAPGKLLAARFIERCIEDPVIERINYITDAAWHSDWAPKTYRKSICYIFNSSPAGLLAYGFMKFYGTHIKERLPKGLQERLAPRIGGNHA